MQPISERPRSRMASRHSSSTGDAVPPSGVWANASSTLRLRMRCTCGRCRGRWKDGVRVRLRRSRRGGSVACSFARSSNHHPRCGAGGLPRRSDLPPRLYFESAGATHDGEERPMNTLPTKKPGDPDVNTIPTWRELAERFRDLVKDFLKEGKELERELEPKLLPALKRFRLEIEKLIAKLEQRAK